jgi:hypothetical protein
MRADSPVTETDSGSRLPLVFKNTSQREHHLTESEIAEIRKLRQEDPLTWSRWKLAKRFGCSALFVGMVCEAGPEKKAIQKQVLEAVKSRWGTKRTLAREDRVLRREMWATDR